VSGGIGVDVGHGVVPTPGVTVAVGAGTEVRGKAEVGEGPYVGPAVGAGGTVAHPASTHAARPNTGNLWGILIAAAV